MTEAAISSRPMKKFNILFGRAILKLTGWTVIDELPDDSKMVLIFAPHTSNWDFFYGLPAAFSIGLVPNWMGKKELFWGPLGWLSRALGGVAVDRSRKLNTVDLTVETLKENDRMVLAIAPESTRSKVEYWRSGFYHIARLAEVPVHFAYADFPTKTIGFTAGFVPSGDMDADIEKIRAVFQGKRGKYPDKIGAIQFKPAD